MSRFDQGALVFFGHPGQNGELAPWDEGLSYVAPTTNPADKFLFRDAVDELGAEIIGSELKQKYSTWPLPAIQRVPCGKVDLVFEMRSNMEDGFIPYLKKANGFMC